MIYIKRSLRDIKELALGLRDYFSLKNQTLWTGRATTGDSITVPNIDKYLSVEIYSQYGEVIAPISNGRIRFVYPDYSQNSNTNYLAHVVITISGTNLSIVMSHLTAHLINGNHSTYTSELPIYKITGHEPKLPESLQRFIMGGVLPLKKWRCCLC